MEDAASLLVEEWPKLESQLVNRHPEFHSLSDEERALVPGGGRFREIQNELDRLDAERETLLPVVLSVRCTTPGALIAKLMLVHRLICDDDHPEAKKLIADAIEDLDRLLPF